MNYKPTEFWPVHVSMKKGRLVEMLRLFNRIVDMKPNRLPKLILASDLKAGAKGWLGDLITVAHKLHLPLPTSFTFQYDLEVTRASALSMDRKCWKEEAMLTSKLCTYVQVKDFDSIATFVKANIRRSQRSVMVKLLCGILPLEVEVGKKAFRLCKLCDGGVVEDKLHSIFNCSSSGDARMEFLKPLSDSIKLEGESNSHLFSRMIGPEYIRETAGIIEKSFYARQAIVFPTKKRAVP